MSERVSERERERERAMTTARQRMKKLVTIDAGALSLLFVSFYHPIHSLTLSSLIIRIILIILIIFFLSPLFVISCDSLSLSLSLSSVTVSLTF